MKEKAFVLCDAEVDYAQQMAEFLKKDLIFPREIIVCSGKEELEFLLQHSQIDKLLISERVVGDELPKYPVGQVILLNESGCVRFPEILNIPKYQSAEGVRKQLLQILAAERVQEHSCLKNEMRSPCVAFYSPVRRCLQTTTAITYSQIHAERKRVLYINMESFSVFCGGDETAPDLGALLCCTDLELESFALRIKAAEKRIGTWSYIMPMYNGVNISEIPVNEWEKLLDKCCRLKGYDLVVLDMNDSVQGSLKLLGECDRVYMITPGDSISAQKIERLETVLEKMKLEKLRRKIVRLQIPFMDPLPECLEAYNRGKLSEWVRKFMIAEEKHGLSGVEAEITESCD